MLYKKTILSLILCFSLLFLSLPTQTISAISTPALNFILLSQYEGVLNIGDEMYLQAITSTGKSPTWKSSDTKIASVDKYGVITAKKAGTVVITAKTKESEAFCYITVKETKIKINLNSASLERGDTIKLSATTSNQSQVSWKSQKRSIASIDAYGKVTALKPGETMITATANGYNATCIITVKSPTLQLSQTKIQLYRNQTCTLSAQVSSKINPKWKTNRSSVATVDQNGIITAKKNGVAIITATVDGVSKTCEVTVMKPDIKLSATELTLKVGESTKITASVSSKNSPIWSTSNAKIIHIDTEGNVKAIKKGKAYLYASEDGTKVRCTVNVTDK